MKLVLSHGAGKGWSQEAYSAGLLRAFSPLSLSLPPSFSSAPPFSFSLSHSLSPSLSLSLSPPFLSLSLSSTTSWRYGLSPYSTQLVVS